MRVNTSLPVMSSRLISKTTAAIGGKQVWDELINNLKQACRKNEQTLQDYIFRLAAAAPHAKLTKRRLLEDSEAIALVLSRQLGENITKEEVLAQIEEHFIYNPKTGWAEPIETIKKDLELVAAYEGELQIVDTVEDALAITKGVSIVSGVAGAGKTSAVVEAAARWTASGGIEKEQVWCVSRNAKTAMDLGLAVSDVFDQRKAGGEPEGKVPYIKIVSLAGLRVWMEDGNGPRPGDRIIVDEYALAEREDLLLLLKLAKNEVPVTLLGDVHQQEAIETPTAAQWLSEAAKSFGQPILGETKRCAEWKDQHDLLRQAPFDELSRQLIISELLRDGNTEVVFNPRELVRSAMKSGVDMLLAIDNETVNLLAVEWRNQLWTASGRKLQVKEPTVKLRDGLKGYVGDSIRVRRIYYDRKERIALTGEVGEIVSIERHLVKIKIINNTSSRVISIPKHRVGKVISLGYVSTIDSAQGMTCSKAGVVLRGGEDNHAFYSGGTRGTKFPKVLIFNNREGLGDGGQYVQEEINPGIFLDQVLSRSNRGPDWNNLDSYKEEFKRRGDEVGENLVIQVLNNAVTHEAEEIIKQPLEPEPVINLEPATTETIDIQEPIQPGFNFEFEIPAPSLVAPQTQTIEKICEDLLTLNVVDVVEVGEELFKRSKEFGEYLLTIDIQKKREIFNKIPDEIALRIVRREMQKKQPDLNILLTWEQVKQAPQQLEQNEREIEF